MDFKDIEHIWKTHSPETLYTVDAEKLHRQITSDKAVTLHTANMSELILIIVNFAAGAIIIALGIPLVTGYIFMYVLAIWMILSALYLLSGRRRRTKGRLKFDRTMLGELDHAISVAQYQVRLGQIMRWNILPVGGLSLLGVWGSGKSNWLILAVALVFVLGHWVGSWENNIYKKRKNKLESLRSKLTNEPSKTNHINQ